MIHMINLQRFMFENPKKIWDFTMSLIYQDFNGVVAPTKEQKEHIDRLKETL